MEESTGRDCAGHFHFVPALCAKLLQSCLTLCELMDYSPPGSTVYGILQARILEWVAISFSREDLPNPGIEPAFLMSPAFAGGFFITSINWEAQSFIEQISLNCELHKCFSVFFFPFKWNKMVKVGWSWRYPFFKVNWALIISSGFCSVI